MRGGVFWLCVWIFVVVRGEEVVGFGWIFFAGAGFGVE